MGQNLNLILDNNIHFNIIVISTLKRDKMWVTPFQLCVAINMNNVQKVIQKVNNETQPEGMENSG